MYIYANTINIYTSNQGLGAPVKGSVHIWALFSWNAHMHQTSRVEILWQPGPLEYI